MKIFKLLALSLVMILSWTQVSQAQCFLTASASASPSPANPNVISFYASANSNAYSAYWSFGDGTVSYSQNPTHTYSSAGTYSYTLVVWDSLGCTDSVGQSITISSNNNCNINATVLDSAIGNNMVEFDVYMQTTGNYSYHWNFGDGTTHIGRNPLHTYPSANTYYYTLTIWDSLSSCGDTISQSITLGSQSSCTIAGAAVDSLISGNMVDFTSYVFGNGNYSYQWNFGDGTVSYAQNTTHTYPSAGTYYYTLYIWDSLGCTDTINQSVTTQGQNPCRINAYAWDSLISSNTVSFGVQVQGGGNYTYLWEFGLGGTSSSQNPTNTYYYNGTYNYTVYVSNGTCTDTITQTVTITGANACPRQVTLSLNLDNYPQETSWDITNSNGTVLYSGNNYANNGQNITQTFCLPVGCYDFNIYDSYGDGICCLYGQGDYTLTDSSGNVLASGGSFAYQETSTICVGGAVNPCASASAYFTSTTNGSSVTFNATSSSASYYNWTFGDGSTGFGNQVSHTYQASPANNYYVVCVDAIDSSGCTVTYCDSIMIMPASCNNDIVTLTLNLDNFPGETSWDLVDAAGAVLYSGSNYTTSGAIVIENFCLPTGCYNFNIYDSYGDGICCQYGQGDFTLTDSAGVVLASGAAFGSSQTNNICVGGATNPCGSLSASYYYSTNPNGTVSFQSSVLGGTAPYSYQWSFNNSSSTQANPSHNYGGNGGYFATLVITDANGCSYTYSDTIMITNVNTNPCGNATMSLNITQNPFNSFALMVQPVINNSPQNSTYGFTWDFGDSTISTGLASHQYLNWGTYVICAVATDTINGCAITVCDTITIDSSGNFSRTHGYKDTKAGFVITTTTPIINLVTAVAKVEKANAISLTPNPATTILTIAVESTTDEDAQLTVLNMQGKTIYSQSRTIQTGANLMNISVNDFPAGTYLVRLTSNKIQQTLKFVKK